MQELKNYPAVLAAMAALDQRYAALVDLCIQIQQIAAPTDAEGPRAQWVQRYWQGLGLTDIAIDAEQNVYARLPGQHRQPAVLVTAHTDTVFPQETDLTVRVDKAEDRIYGPGLGDNSTGVAGLLLLTELLCHLPTPPVDIWFVANSGEEGLGDLRGMRAAVTRLQPQIGACIVLEGMGLKRVVHRALGSRRYRITAKAPGGHSWSDFGAASALHVLSLVASELVQLQTPTTPRTTFNIGRMQGGTSVNTIAQSAWLELDLRSEDHAALQNLITQTLTIVARYQSASWQQKGVQVAATIIGDRPSGAIADDHPLVKAAFRSLSGLGVAGNLQLRISSTDANIPLSCQIPAVCIGLTEGGNAHRQEEWITPSLLPTGMKHLLGLTWWTALWLAGQAK
ncbi:MAG: M20/M25/M40 family metallo-hydrolase [Caldilineaceae bacterium]|nr:M20/M25/M40 family metallo-hydrolase [Caldilineaceae bacterium]